MPPEQVQGYAELDVVEQESVRTLLKSMQGALETPKSQEQEKLRNPCKEPGSRSPSRETPKSKDLRQWMKNKVGDIGFEDTPENGNVEEQGNRAEDVHDIGLKDKAEEGD